ncbi:MAG TPA: hypothetical protein VNU70_02950 [Puia sp.]|jgi:hypothetical protein|nr:hypothetical protein [Puia sp.]
MRPHPLLFLLCVCLGACKLSGGDSRNGSSPLTDSTLYDFASVRSAITGGNEMAAHKQLMAALNTYKNKKDAAGSIAQFKLAILSQPSAVGYFELGSALLDAGQFKESAQALHIAEKLGYTPAANLCAKLATDYTQIMTEIYRDSATINELGPKYDSMALYYMQISLQMGYPHPEEFRNSPVDSALRRWEGFRDIYTNAMVGRSGTRNADQMLWESFKGEFQPVPLPLLIDPAWMKVHKLDNNISYDYEPFIPEMRTAKFSRDVDKEYFYIAMMKQDTAWCAILYAGKFVAMESEHLPAPEFFQLVTFGPSGKIIDKMQVAGQESYSDPYKIFTMHPDLSFEVRIFKNVYKYDPSDAGYDTNEIVRTDAVGATGYRITANGRFERTPGPLASR